MRWVKRIALGFLLVLVVAIGLGAIYQRVMTARDAERFPMPGRLVDIGGRSLHLYCVGSGSPTVVLENGLGANYTSWLIVQPRIAALTRVCSYDRAGMGWSDPSFNPTNAEAVSKDLAALLTAAQIDPPYILVGWSAGGVFVRRFQREHPSDVVGMLFVDSSHEQQRHRLPAPPAGADFERDTARLLALCRAVAWTGAVRLSGAIEKMSLQAKVPDDVRAAQVAMMSRSDACGAIAHEQEGFTPDVSADRGPTSLGDLPLVVLSRGRPMRKEDFGGAQVTDDYLRAADAAWATMQDELAALSTRSTHLTIATSGHMIPFDAPDAVVDAIARLLQTVSETASREPSAAASVSPSGPE